MDEFASRDTRGMRLLPARLARLARDFAIILVRESFFATAAGIAASRAAAVAAVVIFTAAITAAAAATWAARTAAAGFRFRTGFVNFQVAAADIFAIQRRDRFGSFGIIGHFDEAETTRASGLAIGSDVHASELAERFEERAQIVRGGLKAHIADKEVFHGDSPLGKAQPSLLRYVQRKPQTETTFVPRKEKERAVPGRQITLKEARKDCKTRRAESLF
jgi:hypothetical protein